MVELVLLVDVVGEVVELLVQVEQFNLVELDRVLQVLHQIQLLLHLVGELQEELEVILVVEITMDLVVVAAALVALVVMHLEVQVDREVMEFNIVFLDLP
jgi:hypothetical protein